MMKLPDKFQFRVSAYQGYTHTAKLNAHGDYEVKWARGWHLVAAQSIDWIVATENEVQGWVNGGGWLIVDEQPKQEVLPDEFYFEHENKDYSGKAYREPYGWTVNWGNDWPNSFYHESWISHFINKGMWKIVDKKPITAEQQRQLNDFKERVAALEQSIKLNEQDVEHKKRLIANYESTKQDLLKKIEEMA
jgi:hypothetical protein